jgi:hypothetical protein
MMIINIMLIDFYLLIHVYFILRKLRLVLKSSKYFTLMKNLIEYNRYLCYHHNLQFHAYRLLHAILINY